MLGDVIQHSFHVRHGQAGLSVDDLLAVHRQDVDSYEAVVPVELDVEELSEVVQHMAEVLYLYVLDYSEELTNGGDLAVTSMMILTWIGLLIPSLHKAGVSMARVVLHL